MKSALKWSLAAAAIVAVAIAIVFVLDNHAVFNRARGPIILVPRDAPKHGLLGIDFETEPPESTLVKQVVPDSGSAIAGIQAGDEIIAIEDQVNPDISTIRRVTEGLDPGSMVCVTIRREGVAHEFDVQLKSYPELLILRQNAQSHSP